MSKQNNVHEVSENRFYKKEEEITLRFYQMPKSLFNNPDYTGLSLGAKAMYSILRDRQDLSIKNNWIDEENRIYLNFSIESLCEILEVSNKTAISLKKELVKYDLLIDKRMGQGKSNRLYVLKPTTTQNKIDNVDITQKCNIYTSRSEESTLQEVKNLHTNDTDFNKTKEEEEERILKNAEISEENNKSEEKLAPEVLKAYEYSKINKNIGQAIKDKLLALQITYGILLLIKAIEVAYLKNAKSIGYVETLLEDWTSKGITTPDEVDKLMEKWKENNKKARENREKAIELRANTQISTKIYKNNSDNRDNVPQMRNYEERKYDDDFFKNLFRRE